MGREPLLPSPVNDSLPLPCVLADAIAGALAREQEPGTFERARRLVPAGRVPLHEVELPSGAQIAPDREDPYLTLACERARLETALLSEMTRKRQRGFLKNVTNALVSGLPMQVNDDEPTARGTRASHV